MVNVYSSGARGLRQDGRTERDRRCVECNRVGLQIDAGFELTESSMESSDRTCWAAAWGRRPPHLIRLAFFHRHDGEQHLASLPPALPTKSRRTGERTGPPPRRLGGTTVGQIAPERRFAPITLRSPTTAPPAPPMTAPAQVKPSNANRMHRGDDGPQGPRPASIACSANSSASSRGA